MAFKKKDAQLCIHTNSHLDRKLEIQSYHPSKAFVCWLANTLTCAGAYIRNQKAKLPSGFRISYIYSHEGYDAASCDAT